MIFSIKLTRKIWTVMLVSRCLWAEVSMWSTARSALKGWSIERWRVVTPWVGGAVALRWEQADERVQLSCGDDSE